MIKTIQLNNFQVHGNSILNFTEGVNVIVGPSDNGKSSIIRAILWVVFNRPLGNAFISHGKNFCNVKLQVNKESIKKRREKKTAYYFLNGNKFSAFGQSVPEEITEAINLSDINIQKQMDPPFLVGSSSREAAAIINSAIDFTIIENTIQNLNRMRRDKLTSKKVFTAQLDEINSMIEVYQWIDEADGRLKELENLEDKIIKQINSKAELGKTSYRLKSAYETRDKWLKTVGSAKPLLQDCEKSIEHISEFQSLIEVCKAISDAYGKKEKLRKGVVAKKQIDNLIKLGRELNVGYAYAARFEEEVYQIEINKQRRQELFDKINETEKELKGGFFGDVCPLCGQEVKR